MGQKCYAVGNKNWKSVRFNDTDVDAFLYYVKHGDLFLARDSKGIYVKDKSDIVYKNGGCGYIDYGGVLTNGKDILYQDGKSVYLYKNATKKWKAFSLQGKNDVLFARYGYFVYYGKYVDYDAYVVYKYNIKTGKKVNMGFNNAYYCYGKYLLIDGQFHEGAAAPLVLYNMETGKKKTITNNGLYGNAAIISGNKIYYTEYNMKKEIYKLMICDLKTSKKKTVKRNLSVPYRWIDRSHYYRVDSDAEWVYLYNSKTGKSSVY